MGFSCGRSIFAVSGIYADERSCWDCYGKQERDQVHGARGGLCYTGDFDRGAAALSRQSRLVGVAEASAGQVSFE